MVPTAEVALPLSMHPTSLLPSGPEVGTVPQKEPGSPCAINSQSTDSLLLHVAYRKDASPNGCCSKSIVSRPGRSRQWQRHAPVHGSHEPSFDGVPAPAAYWSYDHMCNQTMMPLADVQKPDHYQAQMWLQLVGESSKWYHEPYGPQTSSPPGACVSSPLVSNGSSTGCPLAANNRWLRSGQSPQSVGVLAAQSRAPIGGQQPNHQSKKFDSVPSPNAKFGEAQQVPLGTGAGRIPVGQLRAGLGHQPNQSAPKAVGVKPNHLADIAAPLAASDHTQC